VGKVRIIGATTLGGLKHCKENSSLTNAAMENLVENFSPLDCSDASLLLKHYMVGFFKPGMLLIVNDGAKNRLIEIKTVDAVDEKSKEEILLLKHEITQQNRKIEQLRKRLSDLTQD